MAFRLANGMRIETSEHMMSQEVLDLIFRDQQINPENSESRHRAKRSFAVFDSLSDQLQNYGCWCAKLSAGHAFGGRPLDEVDATCRDWADCRRCQDYATCEGELSENYDVTETTSALGEKTYECIGQTECTEQACKCDLKYAQKLDQLLQEHKLDSNFVDVEADQCVHSGVVSQGAKKCCGESPDWKIYDNHTASCANDKLVRPPAEMYCGSYACNDQSCASPCELATGYYPNKNNCQEYCWCSGPDAADHAGVRVPSRYERCNEGLVWDPFCKSIGLNAPAFVQLDVPFDFGTTGGCCKRPENVDSNECSHGEFD